MEGWPAIVKAASSVLSRTRALLSPILSRSQVQVLSRLRFKSDLECRVRVGKTSRQTF